MSWIMGWGVFSSAKAISRIKNGIRSLQFQNVLQELQILELRHYLNLTMVQVREQCRVLAKLDIRLLVLNKTLMATMSALSHLRYTVSILMDSQTATTHLTVAMISLKENVESVYEYMCVLASHQVNPLVLPPEELQKVLVKVKDDMHTNPCLELPEDPNKNI